MAKERLSIARRRGLGLLSLIAVAGLVALSIAFYNKAFSTSALVTLKTDHTGNELSVSSDVKIRGIIVGSVRSVHVDHGNACLSASDTADCVSVKLAIDPSRLKIIPSNVTAQILPKTLFGEQYVSLGIPADPGPPIARGGVIEQDKSTGALETTQVLADTLPLLKALKPAQLNVTLTAVAQALQGRGTALGQTLVNLDNYLKQLNSDVSPGTTYTSELISDLTKLGKVAVEYNDAAPDILGTLQNLQTSANTLISQQDALQTLLTTATNTSNILSSFLSYNRRNLITVTGTTNKVFALLDKYSPEFSCMFAGLSDLENSTSKIIYNNQINLNIVIDTQPSNLGAYTPGNQPKLVTGYGPSCFGLPDNVQVPFQIPAKFQCLNDGAPLTTNPCSQNPSAFDEQALGSQAETALVKTLVSSEYGATPNRVPDIAAVLAAPGLRGATVKVK